MYYLNIINIQDFVPLQSPADLSNKYLMKPEKPKTHSLV